MIILRQGKGVSTDCNRFFKALAGVPDAVVRRAKSVLSSVETGKTPAASAAPAAEDSMQVSLGDMGAMDVAQELRNTDLNTLTPIEAMNLLFQLKKRL